MGKYAADTQVSSEQSRAEIERTLRRYGATSFAYGWESNRALVAFEMQSRRIRFILPMPDPRAPEFTLTPTRQLPRSEAEARRAYEQAVRQRWRALALVIKAKLEAVDAGIAVFEEDFLAHIVLPNDATVGQFMLPQIGAAYTTGRMPPMLPMPTDD